MKQIVANKEKATIGKALGANQKDPKHFTKKFAKTFSVPGLAEVKKNNPDQLKPTHVGLSNKSGGGPPKEGEGPILNLRSGKNFIVTNAVETILAEPKKSTQAAKDYMHKEDYGRVPKYLSRIKEDIRKEYAYIHQLNSDHGEDPRQTRPLDEEERLELIHGLKAKWESENTEYQGNTHVMIVDTHGKAYRKEKNVAMMTQLEKDIERLNKKNIIVDMNS